jgi:hypothetical protein
MSSARPVFGYLGAVLGVMAIASIAVFTVRGMAAKAHRHWDADIDRIVARQQAKKLEMVTLSEAETPVMQSSAGPQIAALISAPLEAEEDDLAATHEGDTQKVRNPVRKKSIRRADRRHPHYVPVAFANLPKFAVAAIATTTTLFRLR